MQRALAILLLGCLLVTAACTRVTPTPLPPAEIVARSAQRMKSLSGFHFLIDRSGAPAYLDYDNILEFRRAEGDFVVPDQAQATVKVLAPGLVADVKILSIGDLYWQTNPLNGNWEAFPPGTGFNPAIMFDPNTGIQPILETDLSDLELEGVEELKETPGKLLYVVSGTLKGDRIFATSYEMIGPETMKVKIWVEPKTFELYRIILTDPTPDGGESTIWQMDFWDFDKPATIVPPVIPTP